MNLKRGVKTEGVQPQMWFALGVAQKVFQHVAQKDLTVTSLNDSHGKRPKSLHHQGLGADLRTRGLSAVLAASVAKQLGEDLDALGFDVVLEPDHIHVEYDPKNGQAWLREGVA